jgi:hypothetical protein
VGHDEHEILDDETGDRDDGVPSPLGPVSIIAKDITLCKDIWFALGGMPGFSPRFGQTLVQNLRS